MNIKYKFKTTQPPRKENLFEPRKILVHPIISFIYSTYGSNPNLRRVHRRDASVSHLYRTPPSTTRYPDFKMTFYESMRMSFSQVKKILDIVNIRIKTSCGKVLVNSPFYRCLDCEIQNETALATIYCSDCFSQSKHEGHRVVGKMSGENPLNCDCGDICVLKKEGFCSNHGEATEEEFQVILTSFPENMRENFCGVLANVFYALFTLCEDFIKKPDEERKEDNTNSLSQLMEDILTVVKELYKLNSSFKIVISRFLMRSPVEFPQSNMLCHNCSNNKRNEIIPTRKACECTYLTNLLRYHPLFTRELNTYLSCFLADLLVDSKFRIYFSDCLTRNVHFIFPLDDTGVFDCFGLEGLATQAFTGEENCKIILENNMGTIMDLLEEMVDKIPLRFEDLKNQHISTLYGLMNFLHYLPEKKLAGKLMIQKTNAIERFIEIISSLQTKHLQHIIEFSPPFVLDGWNYNVAALSRELELTAQLFLTFGLIFVSMSSNSIEMKGSIYDAYKSSLQKFLKEKSKSKIERKKALGYSGDNSITLHQMIQREFVYLLGHNLAMNNLQANLRNITCFIENTIKHPEISLEKISSIVVKEGLKCIGALSYLTLASTIENFSVSYHYFLPSSPFYYLDMLAIQIFATFIPSKKLFTTFWKYYFVLEESTTLVFDYFFESDWSSVDINDVRRIRAFFEFLAHFLTTEVPVLNSLSPFMKPNTNHFNQSLKSIHAKALTLLIQKFSNQYIDIQTVKNCADLALANQLNHTEILPEICELEKKSGKVKLKTELKQTRQTYFFADNRVEKEVSQSFTENFPDKDSIDSYNFNIDFDVISVLREKFFEGELGNWLSRFYINFKEEWMDFLPHIMKLTLIGLELVKNKTNNKKCELNIKLAFIQNKELVSKLEEIEKELAEKGVGSLSLTLKRIREVIIECKRTNNNECKVKEEINQKEENNEEAERKKRMKQRQLEIQKQFQQKQAAFLQNMKPETQRVFIEEKKIDEEGDRGSAKVHVCHFCREIIDLDGNDYGVPIYVGKCNINFSEKEVHSKSSLTDNMLDSTSRVSHLLETKKSTSLKERSGRSKSCFSPSKKVMSVKNEILKLDHYPFITSCMHMAHIKCHDNYIKDIEDEEAYFFCAYCKSTYNTLLTKSSLKTMRDPRKASVKLNDSQRVPLPFTKTFLKATGVMPSTSGSISANQLSYLIHLLLTGFLQVTKNKSLYDLETFMSKRYLPYKLLFDNVVQFMKDYSNCFKIEFEDSIFSLFYKAIYKMEKPNNSFLNKACTTQTPPRKSSVFTGKSVPSPKYSSSYSKKVAKTSGGIVKSEAYLESIYMKSPIRSLIYQEKNLNSNSILQQIQNNKTKSILSKAKLASSLVKINKKTIPEKKVESHLQEETTQVSYSLIDLEPSEHEITLIKSQLSCLIKEDLEEALQKEILKAMRTKLSEQEIKKILSYGVFLGTLQILTKVLVAHDEAGDVNSFDDIGNLIRDQEFIYIDFKEEITVFLERMLTISFMAFNMKDAYNITEKVQEIISNSNNEEKYIDMLLSIFDPEFDLSFILSDRMLSKLKIEETFFIAWQRILAETLSCDSAKIKAQSLNVILNPQLVIDLPETFLEFCTKYISKKCDLCNNLSVNNHSAICLQCGVVFCLSPCLVKNPWNDNLCDHANNDHKGECIGLCIQTCEVILVCSKFKTFLKESLYVDKFGQSPAEMEIELPNVDWNSINIRKDLQNQLTGWISNHKIVQQIGYEIQKYHMNS